MNLRHYRPLFKKWLPLDGIVREGSKTVYNFRTGEYRIVVTFDSDSEMKAIEVVQFSGLPVFKIVRYKSYPFRVDDATEENRPLWEEALSLVKLRFPEI